MKHAEPAAYKPLMILARRLSWLSIPEWDKTAAKSAHPDRDASGIMRTMAEDEDNPAGDPA